MRQYYIQRNKCIAMTTFGPDQRITSTTPCQALALFIHNRVEVR
jgi:hypothetical protein